METVHWFLVGESPARARFGHHPAASLGLLMATLIAKYLLILTGKLRKLPGHSKSPAVRGFVV